MTCFWDGVFGSLTNQDFEFVNEKRTNISNLIKLLKDKNMKTFHVTWNNESITEKQMEENMHHIGSFNTNTIQQGYDCSIFDPFLMLMCHLFQVSIIHNYNGVNINYKNTNCERRILKFKSSRSHFSRN